MSDVEKEVSSDQLSVSSACDWLRKWFGGFKFADELLAALLKKEAFGIELMVDLETLSTKADAVVTEIGAVFFDGGSGEVLESFESVCCVQSQIDNGRRVDKQLAMSGLDLESPGLGEELLSFRSWFEDYCSGLGVDADGVRVWSKGAMDCSILDHAYAEVECGGEVPWSHRMQRDLRTSLDDSVIDVPKRDVQHTALDDCVGQVDDLMMVRKARVASYQLPVTSDALLDELRRRVLPLLEDARSYSNNSFYEGMVRGYEVVLDMIFKLKA